MAARLLLLSNLSGFCETIEVGFAFQILFLHNESELIDFLLETFSVSVSCAFINNQPKLLKTF